MTNVVPLTIPAKRQDALALLIQRLEQQHRRAKIEYDALSLQLATAKANKTLRDMVKLLNEAQNSPGRGPCVVQAARSLSEKLRPGEP